ncbi:MAG: AraC family transcriptional regulator [Clostridia bacterium]|nr:AraC family transcriptional regulator [Clostridia bacterium]
MDVLRDLQEAEYRLMGSDPKNATPHFADAVELIQTWSEGGYFLVNGRVFPIKPGSLFLIDANNRHYSNPINPARYNRSKVILNAAAWRELLEFCSLSESFSPAFSLFGGAAWDLSPESGEAQRIDRAFASICEAVREGGEFAHLTVLAALAGILAEITRHPDESEAYPLGQKTIHSMARYIGERLDGTRDVSMEEIARELHMSQSHAFHLFRTVTGKNLTDYQTERKIAESKKLLTTTEMRVGEIARTVGYRDPSVFCRRFKQYTGTTPLKYRKENRPK